MADLALGPVHASAVAFDDFGILLIGPSGSGKSALALSLIVNGASLISDDLVYLEQGPTLKRPDTATDLIEARNFGLMKAPIQDSARLQLVVDLNMAEPNRLPPFRTTRIGDHHMVLIAGKGVPNLKNNLLHYIKFEREEPQEQHTDQ